MDSIWCFLSLDYQNKKGGKPTDPKRLSFEDDHVNHGKNPHARVDICKESEQHSLKRCTLSHRIESDDARISPIGVQTRLHVPPKECYQKIELTHRVEPTQSTRLGRIGQAAWSTGLRLGQLGSNSADSDPTLSVARAARLNSHRALFVAVGQPLLILYIELHLAENKFLIKWKIKDPSTTQITESEEEPDEEQQNNKNRPLLEQPGKERGKNISDNEDAKKARRRTPEGRSSAKSQKGKHERANERGSLTKDTIVAILEAPNEMMIEVAQLLRVGHLRQYINDRAKLNLSRNVRQKPNQLSSKHYKLVRYSFQQEDAATTGSKQQQSDSIFSGCATAYQSSALRNDLFTRDLQQ
ncbi:hypothetical protein RND71_035572 [Anisodus tanguticus]|uniref:Uncharacterized protein n=1 Tax=Anisodus tanguticus TaxID=243964 RepID=A0AAE1R5S7_9SOLA|nr:hypothetical protein RND71_035572 [Anisodus tanguticus]